MKYALLLLAMFITCHVSGQNDTDKEQVTRVIRIFQDSFNAHDYSFSGKYDILTPEAYLINPVGMYWKNRAQILEGVQALGQIRLKYETVKYAIKDMHFLAATVAVVTVFGESHVEEDYNYPDGTKGASKGDTANPIYTFVLSKIDNNWKISAIHITFINPAAAHMNPVKE